MKQIFFKLLITVFLFQAFAVNSTVFAAYTPMPQNDIAVERSDTLIWIYRMWYGERQMRLWNESQECWESDWMPA